METLSGFANEIWPGGSHEGLRHTGVRTSSHPAISPMLVYPTFLPQATDVFRVWWV